MKALLPVFLLICLALPVDLPAQHIPANAKRVLFLGNSITYAGGYINYFETFWLRQHPEQPLEIINMGLPSETVSGLSEDNHADGQFPRPDLHERLYRVIRLAKPDLVFACYGMNDGIYLPFDSTRFRLFQSGIRWLHDTLSSLHIAVILVTPPVYDEAKGGASGYAAVLDQYSDWLLHMRDSGWWVADLHYPMKKVLDSGVHLADDGVHPGDAGHRIMAQALLRAIGEKQLTTDTALLELVARRQAILKDAWLTAAGHKRPMPAGLPMGKANQQAAVLTEQINSLLNKK
ncbi:SGNH/GDSL hydrolase family protein [Flavihumibacter petaseus]|uniref:SGNH hydrolase-type esterase domain-containing protein n=1 Tax=Flavihumibacter petaseus NBRC 106054 TaxID=1220578 RepID=A0A0E9MZI9_9BACT|nr:SGNH/GDSL hydrolase family protein [Flavihumibacter petaseus]GAO43004.1 hypothetical protein FPE01S_02_01090 [Flavihumibacter petaseus NBRC 106054]